MLQYLALALFGTCLSLHTIDSKWIQAGMESEARYYLNNTRGRFYNRGMNEGDKLNSYLRVNTQFTAFEFLDFSLGAQGWAIRSGFSGGQIGGIWGVRMRLTDEFEFGWEHFSCHVSTGGGVTAQDNCGSEDSIILRFNYNFDTRKKSSILGKIIR